VETEQGKHSGKRKMSLRRRTLKLLRFDRKFRDGRGIHICGLDEAGRGPLAGPVVAAAVIFSDDVYIEGVYDSKMLSPHTRASLYEKITSEALTFSIGIVDSRTIDKLNIYNASILAMDMAISKLKMEPGLILADGNFYKRGREMVEDVVNGDKHSFAIAAASIIAKVTRDRLMSRYEMEFPNFTFSRHKGYATKGHIEEIDLYGYTPIHRRSFHAKALRYMEGYRQSL
jgi:ribonuclease HII